MTGAERLPAPFGRWLDRGRPLSFTFEGRAYRGLAGDCLSAALAANGRWVLSRSFKYHRPRGIHSLAGHEANGLVQLGDEPNANADLVPLSEGLAATAQNAFGGLERDRGRLVEPLGRFLPVGFYYKAFFRPRGAWRYWEPLVRRMAGLGRIGRDAPHPYHDKAYLFADVAVVGGGPAGLSAALEAAQTGAEVTLIEEMPELGGSLAYARFDRDGARGAALLGELTEAVRAHPLVTVLTAAVATGWFADNLLSIVRGRRLYKLRARQVAVATGSAEQPMVFRNNDLPGVMLGSAAQRLMRLYGVRPGRRAVVATANADGYGVALDLLEAGVEVAAVVDLRPQAPRCGLTDAVRDSSVPIHAGHATWAARPNGTRLAGVTVAPIAGRGRCGLAGAREIECDLLATSTGYAPLAALVCHAGPRLAYDGATHTFACAEPPRGVHAAGSVAGTYDLDAVLAEGRYAGWRAARAAGFDGRAEPRLPNDRGAHGHTHPWPIFPHPKGKDFVDFDEDLQVHDLADGVAEGFADVELVKRYTTVGTGPSQGRHSHLNALRIAADLAGRDAAAAGSTTLRPPFRPEKVGVLAGRGFAPTRRTAAHHRHLELGARMMVAGAWRRPAFYGPPERREELIAEEAVNVRTNVGLMDVSTLGGIEVRGPDAAEFLNRSYTFAYARQPVGRLRYLLMTDERGVIVDDGVACRLGAEHFYLTATTGAVDGVVRQMLWWNARWRLDVDIANVTAAYAGFNLAGPWARDVLAPLCPGLDLSRDAFPHLGVREAEVAGVPARLLRVGFVGEAGYEVHVPASCGEAVWDALMAAGAPFGIRPFGVEAQRLLRLEKGHIIVGQDTDDLTTPIEADMAWAVSGRKPFFVGKRALAIPRKANRRLAGFTLAEPDAPVPKECHLVVQGGRIVGRVTSCARSPTLGRVIGLAFLPTDEAEPGRRFAIKVEGGRLVEAEVTPPPFYDPKNERQEL